MQKIENKIASGIAYNTICKIVIIGVQAITSISIARILTSSDYGIISYASVFIGIVSQFSDFGLGSAIIQRKDVSEKVLNTAFTIRNILSITLFSVILIISFIVPYYNNTPHIGWVIRIMGLNFIFHSFGFISSSLLKREMNFLWFNIASVISITVGSVVLVTMAYMGYGFWSLISAGFVSTIVNVIAFRIIRPCTLKYEFDITIARELWKFGSYILVSGVIIYLLFNSSNFVVGTICGVTLLGYFSLALDWGTKIPALLSQTVLTVLFPAFSSIRGDRKKLLSVYYETLHYVAFFSILTNITLLMVSDDFLMYVLGKNSDKWLPASVCLKIFCIYGISRSLIEPIGNIIMSEGDTKILFKANLIALVLQLLLIYPAIKKFNIEGVAFVLLISYSSQYLLYLYYLKNKFSMKYITFYKSISIPIYCILSFILTHIAFYYANIPGSLILTFIKIITYASIYALVFGFATNWRLYYSIVSVVKK